MINETTFVRMRSGDHLGDKNVEKRHSLCRISLFNNCDRQKRFRQNERRRADLQKRLKLLNF